jgi:hypothetical protein
MKRVLAKTIGKGKEVAKSSVPILSVRAFKSSFHSKFSVPSFHSVVF